MSRLIVADSILTPNMRSAGPLTLDFVLFRGQLEFCRIYLNIGLYLHDLEYKLILHIVIRYQECQLYAMYVAVILECRLFHPGS